MIRTASKSRNSPKMMRILDPDRAELSSGEHKTSEDEAPVPAHAQLQLNQVRAHSYDCTSKA